MENKQMQQAKDTIAKKYGYENFEAIPYNHISSVNVRYENYQDIVNEVAIEYHRLMSEWVSVEIDLPNIEKEVLVFHKTQGCIIMRLEYTKSEKLIWYDTEGQHCDFELITHWKPLPQPPK